MFLVHAAGKLNIFCCSETNLIHDWKKNRNFNSSGGGKEVALQIIHIFNIITFNSCRCFLQFMIRFCF